MPWVLVLPLQVGKAMRADASLNNKKEGILGVPQLDKHLIFMHRGDIHMIDLSILSSLAEFFTGSTMGLISDLRLGWRDDDTIHDQPSRPPITLDRCLALARDAGEPEFDPFHVHPGEMAIIGLAERCRTCDKTDNPREGVKMSLCAQCKSEKRQYRALYCSPDCQKIDWRARHKQEHAGTLAWGLGA